MKYIKTKDWFLAYTQIMSIYKKNKANVDQKLDKKGNVVDKGYTVYYIYLNFIDVQNNESQSEVTFTNEAERDLVYEEVIKQVVANEQEESKNSLTTKATKGTTNTRMKLNE